MGICLSCIRPSESDDDPNENTSLLRGQYNDEYLQEAQTVRYQQRQQELGGIVNDLSDNLIDVSSFIGSTPRPSFSPEYGATVYPRTYTDEEKQAIIANMKLIDDATRNACIITQQDPLLIEL